jgi:acyl-CoA dehydrogenase
MGPDHSLTAMARYLNNRAGSIYGGSNEVQRNIMARLVLGL